MDKVQRASAANIPWTGYSKDLNLGQSGQNIHKLSLTQWAISPRLGHYCFVITFVATSGFCSSVFSRAELIQREVEMVLAAVIFPPLEGLKLGCPMAPGSWLAVGMSSSCIVSSSSRGATALCAGPKARVTPRFLF